MATSSGVQSRKEMKRLESRKSHSWWWDSHISPKNSKWLSENLEEMEQYVKRMLKLIEQDADSFAKRADMYYQKRPELIALVEEFYRGYRALVERYNNLTVELRKNIPSDLQSQGSGVSDVGSEPSSNLPSPKKGGRRKSTNRAAGFDFFLGSGGNGSDANQKDGDESSTLTDSEEESDDSSVNNYSGFLGNGSDPEVNRRIMELESELREVKEKLWNQENTEDVHAKINAYEKELIIANEKLRLSEEEITKLKIELGNYRPLDSENLEDGVKLSSTENYIEIGGEALEFDGANKESVEPNSEIESLGKELRITKEKLEASEKQIATLKFEADKSSERIQQLQEQLDSARKDSSAWKVKFNGEKRESTKFQERLARLKASLSDRDHEVRDLKTAVSDAEEKIFPEKAQLKSEMSKLSEERAFLQEQVRDWESRGRAFEDEIRTIQSEKIETEEALMAKIESLKAEIEERGNAIKDLGAKIASLKEEVNSRDGKIEQMENHLNQLHIEHVLLISAMEAAHKQVEELKSKAEQLEEEVERQKTAISEGAEEKREAIRQLCFSLEHYRNGYKMLRQHFTGHKRVPPVLAA